MGTTRLGIFPSLDNKVMYDLVDKGLTEWILGRFPNDFFTHVFIPDQSSVANNFTLNKDGELIPVNTAPVLQPPYVRMNVTHSINNQSEVFGTDIMNPNQQPGAFMIDTDLTGYRPIYQDPFHVIISLNERTIRCEFTITMTVQNKADQIGLMNYLDTFLKMNYVQVIDIPTVIPMHNLLMEYVRSCIFKPEILALDRMIDDKDTQNKFKSSINEMFMAMMYDYSQNHIKPYKPSQKEKDSEGNLIDIKNYSYCYNQMNKIYVKFDKYSADEGNKKNNLYNSFSVSVSGNFDVGIPISFITSIPAIIRGTRNNWYLKSSDNKTRDNYYQMIQFKEVFEDNRHLVALNPNIWRHFYYEKELMMSSVTENFNILDDIIDISESPSHYYIMKALLSMVTTQEEFNKLFKVVIYKNDEPIDNNLFEIDKEFNFKVYQCNLTVPYYIDVFINASIFKSNINAIRTKLENNGINWWNYFDKAMKNEKDISFSYFTNIIKTDFKSYFLGQSGKINNSSNVNYRYVINPYESNTHVDRGYRGIGYIPHYKVQKGTDIEFVPIKYINFIVPDTQFEYYILNSDNKYIKLSNDEIASIVDKLSVFIKVGNQYVECDYDKIMIADTKYKYYIYDKATDTFILQTNLTYFDKIQQYYILKSEYNYNTANLESWN